MDGDGRFFPFPGKGRVRVFRHDYPAGSYQPLHHHDVPQLLHAVSGVMRVTTPAGFFVVPPARALWIPPGVEHEIAMIGAVGMRSAYVRTPEWSEWTEPVVFGITPLMRELVVALGEEEALGSTMPGARHLALEELLLLELPRLRPVALSLPFPGDAKLAALCRCLLDEPTNPGRVEDVALRFGMSARSLRRAFQAELGMSFSTWRQQARVVEATARLVEGENAGAIANRLGYGSIAAFSAMFKRVTGMTPTDAATGRVRPMR
jgi:AraC-like DNA-binding protein/quercetin dioxygenase-like cupin family protein